MVLLLTIINDMITVNHIVVYNNNIGYHNSHRKVAAAAVGVVVAVAGRRAWQ